MPRVRSSVRYRAIVPPRERRKKTRKRIAGRRGRQRVLFCCGESKKEGKRGERRGRREGGVIPVDVLECGSNARLHVGPTAPHTPASVPDRLPAYA
eukprot:236664-Rhodomonas_salina.1